jgi:hypothetical protein
LGTWRKVNKNNEFMVGKKKLYAAKASKTDDISASFTHSKNTTNSREPNAS